MKPAAKPAREIPWAGLIAAVALAIGAGCVVTAVYLLAGLGWAVLAAGVPFLMLAAVLVRGLRA